MTYMYPFPEGTRISQLFGSNPSNGVNPAGGHTGTDWAVPVGTPVRAAGDGVIELSSWVSANYLENPWWLTQMGGDTMVLNCGDSKPTFIYAHLSDSIAEVGTRVKKGDIIALSGNSGTASTGPHTHMEALPPAWNFQNGTYGRVNPDAYLDEYWTGISVQGSIKPPEGFLMALTDKQQLDIYWMLCVPEGRQFMADLIGAGAAKATLNTTLPRGGGIGGNTSLAGMVAWNDAHVVSIISAVAAQAASGGASVDQIKTAVTDAIKNGVDEEAIAKAVNDDAAKRMAK